MLLKDLKLTPKRLELLEKLGLNSIEDVLSYYPFRYENYAITHYDDFKVGEICFFEGELLNYPSTFRYKGNMSITRFKILYEDEELAITVFNRPWFRNMHVNDKITIYGKYEGNNKITAINCYSKNIKEIIGINPIYPLKEGIKQNSIKKIIEVVFDKVKDDLIDYVPQTYLAKHNLISYKEALENIHFPKNINSLRKAIARLKYEEFLRFYLALDIMKGHNATFVKPKKEFTKSKIEDFISSLGFKFTLDQEKAVDDILKDIASDKIMYRLLQGEVGSGKTAVAMVALYANYLAGYQGALMVPTEILAKQHYLTFKKAFAKYNVNIGLLYSAMDNDKQVKEALKNGQLDIAIGTHALFSEDVEFKNLGLVIADEQHRFGVKQRRKLKEKGAMTDFILMSATPIPRTLASSIYGDMDISTIETLPLDRKGCDTFLIKKNSIVDILPKIKSEIASGKQVYIIAAAIIKSENYSAKDLTSLYESLVDVFKPYKVALLHGKMSSNEKDDIMKDFNANKIQVLISTTVVEVGVNVKNATMMVIYDADKFGLSQLHQLRGRIQRGNERGKCYLLTDSKNNEALKRLEVLVNSNDGFKIAYEDLKQRGPGDILGTRQSGLPTFILGNLLEDTRFINAAREDAKEIFENQDNSDNKKYCERISELASKNYGD